MGVRVSASASINIVDSNIHFRASQPLNNFKPEGTLQLDDFYITDLGHMEVSVHGLQPLNWIVGM